MEIISQSISHLQQRYISLLIISSNENDYQPLLFKRKDHTM